MAWERLHAGVFQSDLGLLAPYELSGDVLPEKMRPEWQLSRRRCKPGMDEAEVDAFTALVRAFLLYKPTNPLNVMVGWCVNDYQIDIATPEGRAEYKRILDRVGRARRGARAVRAIQFGGLAPRDEPRRLEMGVRPLARPRPEDPA